MIAKNFSLKVILIASSLFSIYILYNTFVSFRYQLLLRQDTINQDFTLSADDLESIPEIPNIGITTLPIISQKAKYYIFKGDYANGIEMLEKGAKINPHIYYSDYLLGSYYLQLNQLDSAYIHAKKALYGWPKNIEHYKLYNQVLEAKKDTTGILDAFDYINTVFSTKDQHEKLFIDSYSNAKLRYLIFKYPDERSITKDFLIGTWQQMYEFETGLINYRKNTIKIDKFNFISNDDKQYSYDLTNDTLKLYFKSNKKLISSFPVFYSDSLNTLIFKNLPMSVIEDQPLIQDQFFKKIED